MTEKMMIPKPETHAEIAAIGRRLLQELPVSVNNFYGDPMLQWQDTCYKLESLVDTGQTGPVGLITKGVVSPQRAAFLAGMREKGLNLGVLVSISELPEHEKVGMAHRYEAIRNLKEADVPVIAYVRPMVPPYNTSEEVVARMFEKLADAGAEYVVGSGFRGDDNIVGQMSPEDKEKWVMRVKLMTGEVFNRLKRHADENGMHLFTRTSCGVSTALQMPVTYNPYYYSPNLVHCEELACPSLETCTPSTTPKPGSLEFLSYLGFDVRFSNGNTQERCSTQPDKRLNCPSCCTTCYMLDVPHIEVGGNVNLGDLTFIRFMTGMLANQVGVNDTGERDIAQVRLPNFPQITDIQCLNSWWALAHKGDRCFDCNYCVEQYYQSGRNEFGFPPAQLIERIGL